MPRVILGLSVAVTCGNGCFTPQRLQNGAPLYGDLRWEGWASALQGGYADTLIVVGGREIVPVQDAPADLSSEFMISDAEYAVPRGYAACHAIRQSFSVSEHRLHWIVSEGNTGGNAVAIQEIEDSMPGETVVVTSILHLPRAGMDLCANGMGHLPLVPAEAFTLAHASQTSDRDRSDAEARMRNSFGGCELAERMVKEISGAADKLNGVYQPLAR